MKRDPPEWRKRHGWFLFRWHDKVGMWGQACCGPLVLQAAVAMHSSAWILFPPHSAHSGAAYMYWHALALHTTRKPDSSWDGTFWRVNLVQLFNNKQEHSLSNCSTVRSMRIVCWHAAVSADQQVKSRHAVQSLAASCPARKVSSGGLSIRSLVRLAFSSTSWPRTSIQNSFHHCASSLFPHELAANVWALLRVSPLREAQKQLVSPYFDWLGRCRPGSPRYRHHDSNWRRFLHHFPQAAASAEISPSLSEGDGIRSISSKTLRCD